MPTSDTTLILFATHLALERISHATIKVNLAVIHNTHISAGLHSHYGQQLTLRLQLVVKGIKKTLLPLRHRSSIILDIMRRTNSLLSR